MGFFPGQASFAYFFFFGSSGSSNWLPSIPETLDIFGGPLITMPPIETAVFGGGGAISISGAGFGNGIPSLDESEDAKSDGPL